METSFKGKAPISRSTVFVQTENQAHEAWGLLTDEKPKAASLLHRLVALVDSQNAGVIVISNDTLAQMTGWCTRTVQRATADLVKGNWIQRIQLSKTVQGYAVNACVGWAGFVANKNEMAAFNATIIIPKKDMPEPVKLRRIPILYPPGEIALPVETGGEPGSQLQISGLESSMEIMAEPKDFEQVPLPLPPVIKPVAGDACPKCNDGTLIIKTRKVDGIEFLACDRFPICK